MFTQSILAAAFAAISTVSAHSWLECVDHDDSQIRQWMKGNSTLNPPVMVDPTMPGWAHLCKAWPRGKKNPGDWIDESSYLSRNIQDLAFTGNTAACGPRQNSVSYDGNAPMAIATPGQTLNLRFGGNGHVKGAPYNPGGDPGDVQVLWAGKKETEITDIKQITDGSLKQIAKGGFAEDAFYYPDNVITPAAGLVDKGNWLRMTIPSDMEAGRHMLLWVWSFNGKPQWSSCFDVMVSGNGKSASSAAVSAASASYAPASSASASYAPASSAPVSSASAKSTSAPAIYSPVAAAAASVTTSASVAPVVTETSVATAYVDTTVTVEPTPAASSSRSYPPPKSYSQNEKVNSWWKK